MKKSHKVVASIVAAATLSLGAIIAHAMPSHEGQGRGQGMGQGMEHSMGQHAMNGKDGEGKHAEGKQGDHSKGHGGMKGEGGHGKMGQSGTRGEHAALMTPEARAAVAEKMRNAKTPEERQKIATDTRAEMQKLAEARGITLPQHRRPAEGRMQGPGAGAGQKGHVH